MADESSESIQNIAQRYHEILKCRDDKEPVLLYRDPQSHDGQLSFRLVEGSKCSWIGQSDFVDPDKLRQRIEPWLTALFQTEHFSLLVGSGLTHALHWMGAGSGLPGMAQATFMNYAEELEAAAISSAQAAGREEVNFEDQLRVANELLRGLQIMSITDESLKEKTGLIKEELNELIKNFADSILEGENGFIQSNQIQLEDSLNYLVSFLMSFASRTGTRERLQIFTTNYDRFIEMGAETAGLHLLDRFVGTLAPIFRSSRLDTDMHYNPPGIRGEPRYLEGVARFTKLHGSVDWVNTEYSIRRASVPFGAESIKPYLTAPGLKGAEPYQLMIYPNSSKDRETAAYPYVELFRDFAAAICRPNSTLVTYGYSFGDEHINRVIEDMLTIPSTHLVVISYDDRLNRIMNTYKKLGRHAQISLLVGKHLGDLRALVDYYLPKPAIDRTTFRMAELLKARWGVAQERPISESNLTSVEPGNDQ